MLLRRRGLPLPSSKYLRFGVDVCFTKRARNIRHSRGAAMSKNKKSSKTVIFALTMPKTEIPFTTLSTPLKKFGKLREDFETLGLRVEVVNFKK
jgi:hypothetical protein